MPNNQCMTLVDARNTLQRIYSERRYIDKKGDYLLLALHSGAAALERRNAKGAHFRREAAILRYHANNPNAIMMHDDYMRGALLAAINVLNAELERMGKTEHTTEKEENT